MAIEGHSPDPRDSRRSSRATALARCVRPSDLSQESRVESLLWALGVWARDRVSSEIMKRSETQPWMWLSRERLMEPTKDLARYALTCAARLMTVRSVRELLELVRELFNLSHALPTGPEKKGWGAMMSSIFLHTVGDPLVCLFAFEEEVCLSFSR